MKKLVSLVCALSCFAGFEAYGMATKEKNIVNVEAPKGFPRQITLVPIDDPMGTVFGGFSHEQTFTSRSIKTNQAGTHKLTEPFTLPVTKNVALLVFLGNSDTVTIFNEEALSKLKDTSYTLVIDSNDKATLKAVTTS